jgi:hypothetical protein
MLLCIELRAMLTYQVTSKAHRRTRCYSFFGRI